MSTMDFSSSPSSPETSVVGGTRREEKFPVDSFRYLDGRLHDVRIKVMREAAKLAEHDSSNPKAYTVEPKHVEQAFREYMKSLSLELAVS